MNNNLMIDIKGVLKQISDNSKKMYESISELEDLYTGRENYIGDMHDLKVSELESYMADYIRSSDVSIRFLLEYCGLEKLLEKYVDEYESMSVYKVEYYSEVDVFDSPIWGMMCRYISVFNHVTCVNGGNQIDITNISQMKADLSNKNTNDITNHITNESIYISSAEEVLQHLKDIKISDEEVNNILHKKIQDVRNELDKDKKDVPLIKSMLSKIRSIISECAEEKFTEEAKRMLPFLMKKLYELILSNVC